MKDSAKLLDLLAAEGSDDIEPTKAAAGRQELYPEVCPDDSLFEPQPDISSSIFQRQLWQRASRLVNCIKDISMQINTTI